MRGGRLKVIINFMTVDMDDVGYCNNWHHFYVSGNFGFSIYSYIYGGVLHICSALYSTIHT